MVSVQREVYQELSSKVFGNVLDAGCGTGRIMAYLQDNPHLKRYVGIDASHDMIKHAAWLKDQLAFEQATLELTRIEQAKGHFDCIVSIHSYYSWTDAASVLKHLRQLLSDRGKFLLVTPNDGFNAERLTHLVKQELLGHPYYEDFLATNQAIASTAKAKNLYVSTDELISRVRESGFKVNAAHSNFFLGGASYLELSKAL